MYRIETYNADNQRAVNKFYKLHKQNVNASKKDRIVIASSEIGNQIVGVAMVRDYGTEDQPVWLLRSVFVTPRMRKLGIATDLINEAITAIDELVYTLCEPNLVRLYQLAGFVTCQSYPSELINLKTKKDLTLLVRPLFYEDDDLIV